MLVWLWPLGVRLSGERSSTDMYRSNCEDDESMDCSIAFCTNDGILSALGVGSGITEGVWRSSADMYRSALGSIAFCTKDAIFGGRLWARRFVNESLCVGRGDTSAGSAPAGSGCDGSLE